MSNISENPVEAGYQFGLEAGAVKEVSADGVPYAVIPNDAQLVNMEKLLRNPIMKRGRPSFDDLASFAKYVDAQGTAETVIFADFANARYVAVFDYHEGGSTGTAGWKEHTASLNMKYSDEWNVWAGSNKSRFGQLEFAQFIDRNMADIVAPPGADLLELSSSLVGRVSTEFGSIVRGSSERQNFVEVREASGQAGVEVPQRITLSLPVYKLGAPYTIEARLRVIVESKKLVLHYDLLNMSKVVERANQDVREAVEAATKIECYLGRME